MSIDSEMDEDNMVHIYNGILVNQKKKRKNSICGNREGPRNCLWVK